MPRLPLLPGAAQLPVLCVPKYTRFKQLATLSVPVKPLGSNELGTAPAACVLVIRFDGKFVPFQKLVLLLAELPGRTARCKTVSDAVSITRSPPVKPRRSTSTAELVAQFMKLPLKPVPPQVRLVAAPVRLK